MPSTSQAMVPEQTFAEKYGNVCMNKYLFLFSLILVACTASKYMTFDDYHNVTIGQNISDIQVQMGRPYEVKELAPGKQEYVYIERIPLGDTREMFRKYILVVEEGKVINKQLKEETSSPFQFFGQ